MSDFLTQLFREKVGHDVSARVDRAYVSEFTDFMKQFLETHPEVVTDQQTGKGIYWDKIVDFAAQENAEKDSVPDDNYGFSYSAWVGNAQPEKDGRKLRFLVR